MGAKYQNLKKLLSKDINVHEFLEVTKVEELLEYADKNALFTIRFDRDKDYLQLPFYIYEEEYYSSYHDKVSFFERIVAEAQEKKCTLLISNGYMEKPNQVCNFVIRFNNKSDFILEWSTRNVPLRTMYDFPTTVLKGNIKEDFKDMEWINPKENKLSNKEVEKLLVWALSLGIKNKDIEATMYSKKVGMLKQEIVCWQIVE